MGFTDQIDISQFKSPAGSFTRGLQGGLQLGIQALSSKRAAKAQEQEVAMKGFEFNTKRLAEGRGDSAEVRAALMNENNKIAFDLGWSQGVKNPDTGEMGPKVVTAAGLSSEDKTFKEWQKAAKNNLSDFSKGLTSATDFALKQVDLTAQMDDFSDRENAIAKSQLKVINKAQEATVAKRNRKVEFGKRVDKANQKAYFMSKGMSPEVFEDQYLKFPEKFRGITNDRLGAFGLPPEQRIRAIDALSKTASTLGRNTPQFQSLMKQIEQLRTATFSGTAQPPGGFPGAGTPGTPKTPGTPGIPGSPGTGVPGIPNAVPGATQPAAPTSFSPKGFLDTFK